jgi:membrane associated rhomboid family serine protease
MQTEARCYRHPDRPAPIGCSRCGRPVCLPDAIDAPVGYLCPECAAPPPHVQRAQRRVAAAQSGRATSVLLGIIGVVYLGQLAIPDLWVRGALFGPAIAAGEWWRVLTSGFLHAQSFILHVAFNSYLLYQLGRLLEPGIGSSRFLAVWFAGLFGGSAGALLLTWSAPTIGASGAVFGLMGGAMVLMRRRGINPWQTSIGTLVLINLVFTVVAPGVSLGGHLGGLAGGALAAVVLGGRGRADADLARVWGIVAGLAVLAVVLGVAGPVVRSL